MPNIQITDQFGVNIDAELAPASALLKYARDLPHLIMQGGNIGQLQLLKLSDPAVRSLSPTLTFQQPLSLGTDAPCLTIGADAGASFRVISRTAAQTTLFSSDDYGEDIEIPQSACYFGVGLHGSVNAGVLAGSGALTFGVDAGGGIAIDSYRPFSAGPDAVTITEALRRSIAEFILPAGVDDLAALAPGAVVTITGHGRLTFSATANLLAVANPLATLALPGPIPALAVTQTGSVTVGASWEISAAFQVRVQKLDSGRVHLGWYRKRDTDFSVSASAAAGIAAGTATTDLLSRVIGAISSDAAADQAQLTKAGLSAGEAQSIDYAVKAAVNRSLELAVSAELGSVTQGEAAFLYEVDLARLDSAGKEAIHAALTGNLSHLADAAALPAGITEVRSILSKARARRFVLKVNLLGIFNIGSISELALSGSVTFAPSSGELLIVDQATASRIQTGAVNFGADEEKLRHVMAESFLITAAYRGSRTVVSAPHLSSSHSFFRLDNNPSLQDVKRWAAISPALGLGAVQVPAGIASFGRSAVLAAADYDEPAAQSLFLDASGAPRDPAEYEAAGRRAVALLVPADGDDAFRLRPATDDQLWNQMKSLGPANFGRLLPQMQADGVRPDYLAIMWWVDSMRSTAEILAEINRYASAAGAAPDDPGFQKMRQDLASHLRDVASKAHEQFGSPWGLVAMFLASGMKARASLRITGPRFVLLAAPALGAGV